MNLIDRQPVVRHHEFFQPVVELLHTGKRKEGLTKARLHDRAQLTFYELQPKGLSPIGNMFIVISVPNRSERR